MRTGSLIRTVLQPIAIGIVLALLVRATLFRMYAIPSQSMAPTLQAGDQIIVTPYRTPFSAIPQRGDVVVFHSPIKADELMVKRIIAVPGDLIEAHNGRVYIGGHALPEPYLSRVAASGAIAPQIIAPNCYFVAGDNRGNSWDSRNWGLLPRSLVVGRARMILWSWGNGATESPRADAAPLTPHTLAAHPLRLDRLFEPVR